MSGQLGGQGDSEPKTQPLWLRNVPEHSQSSLKAIVLTRTAYQGEEMGYPEPNEEPGQSSGQVPNTDMPGHQDSV